MSSKLTPELLAERPGLADDPNARHPFAEADPINDPYAPPKFYTPELHAKIVSIIEKGNRPEVAAGMAGITSQRFHLWLRLGRDGHPAMIKFTEDVELAKHRAEGHAVEILNTGMYSEDQKLAAANVQYWLTTQRGEGWSKEADTKAKAMIGEFMARLEAALPPEVFATVIAAATGQTLAAPKQVFQLSPMSDDSQEAR